MTKNIPIDPVAERAGHRYCVGSTSFQRAQYLVALSGPVVAVVAAWQLRSRAGAPDWGGLSGLFRQPVLFLQPAQPPFTIRDAQTGASGPGGRGSSSGKQNKLLETQITPGKGTVRRFW